MPPQQIGALPKSLEQLAVIDVEAERLRGSIQVGAVHEERDLLPVIEHGR